MIRWMILLASLVYLADSLVAAQEVPFVNDEPVVNQTLDTEMFDFISKTLGAARMYPHMQCTLKTRSSREQRTFLEGSEWVETLEVDFSSNGFDSGYKIKFVIPSTAKFGLRKNNNHWSGLGEDIRIELDDFYGHWLSFTHDGKGRLVRLILGNNLRIVPCQVR